MIDLNEIDILIRDSKQEVENCVNVGGFISTVELAEHCEQLVEELKAAREIVECAKIIDEWDDYVEEIDFVPLNEAMKKYKEVCK